MSFLNWLTKGVGIGAAPFSGGASLALMGIDLGASTLGSYLSGRAQSKGLKRQLEAERYAAELQDRAQREALDFAKHQAQQDWRTGETDRRANYDQWAARRRGLSGLTQALGYGALEIPAYVGSPDPGFTAPSRSMGQGSRPVYEPRPGAPPPVDLVQDPVTGAWVARPRRTLGGYLTGGVA